MNISMVAGESKTLQVQFKDSFGNPVTPQQTDVIAWEVTGPATLGATYPSEATKRVLTSNGQVGSGTVKATLNPGPGEKVASETFSVAAGPIATGVIVVIP